MKYKKLSVKGYKTLNMYPVYVGDIYHGQEPFKIVGIREDGIELEGDYSGGTHGITQHSWISDERCFVVSEVCEQQLNSKGCQVHNLFCCGGGNVINDHVNYWDDIVE
jgi:predicted nucleotide-binding protein (sugar kinase/HSP70/actin superfamily)